MKIDKQSVFLLTSSESARNKSFGTGFAVACNDSKLFLLTCAHVVEQLGRSVIASGADAIPHEAEIEAAGSSNAVDLALLSIPCRSDAPPLLNRTANGKPDMRFQIFGYGPHFGAKENYVLRDIQGRLGKPISFKAVGIKSIEAWDIHVDDDDFSKLQGGYSGSPLCDEDGRIVAVVSHNADPAAGQRGHAVAISNLKTIFPGIEQLIPSFSAPRPAAAPADRLARAGKRFRSLLFDFDIDDRLCKVVRNEFKRMEEEGIAAGDEELLGKIENADADAEKWTALVRFLEVLDRKARNSTVGPNYEKLAEQLNNGHVVLCLGQELSHLLGAPFPSTAQIIARLAAEDFHGPLSELCEQKEIAPESSRTELVSELRTLFCMERKTPPAALYALLTQLERPFLAISTSYDDLLEQCLHGQRNFVVIAPQMEEKKCLLRYSDQKEAITCAPEEVSQHKPLENGYSVIYRLRGGIISQDGHLLLSERDYFAFARCMEKQFPDYIGSRLKSSLYSLWFLGHHPESWEERLLVKFLQTLRYDRAAALAVQEKCSPFVQAFWQDSKVRICNLSLTDFVHGLEQVAA